MLSIHTIWIQGRQSNLSSIGEKDSNIVQSFSLMAQEE